MVSVGGCDDDQQPTGADFGARRGLRSIISTIRRLMHGGYVLGEQTFAPLLIAILAHLYRTAARRR